MFVRSIASILIVTSAFILAIGQTPDTKKDKEKAVQHFSWSFDGDGAYLGVQTQEVTKENFAKFGLREVRGVAVEKVMENSPAAAAGLQAGDVILRFNNEEVTGSRKLTRLISEVDPDHQVSLTILRGGREQTVTATLGKNPGWARFGEGNFKFDMPNMPNFDFKQFEQFKDIPRHFDFKGLENLKDLPHFKGDFPFTFNLPDGQDFTWHFGGGRQIGVSAYAVTKQLGEKFGVDGGVMVNEVRENSPAAKAGLRAGDIVVEVGGKPVKNNADLIKGINERKDGDVTLTIVRDRSRQTVTVTPEPAKDGTFFFQHDDSGLFAPRAIPNVAPEVMLAPRTPLPPQMPVIRSGRII
jgi:serine protease Do